MILSIVLLTPLFGLVVLLFIPAARPELVRLWANLVAFAGFLISLPLLLSFDRRPGMQFTEALPWIPSIGANYLLGVDGYSALLVVMTTLLGFLAILSSWNSIDVRVKEYYAYFLFLQFSLIGVFIALDAFLFFVFWELSLVPMYLIIAIWGGERKAYAAIKFLIYTLAGSVLMFLGILMLYWQHGAQTGVYTFAWTELLNTSMPQDAQWWVFLALFAGFAVKVPMWPFHTWLPDAHVEAPTAGSVILAGVLLKMGTYGFLRFSLPLVPDAARDPAIVTVMGVLSIIAIVYGALVSLMQKDWKKLVAYSSVSHLGFCTLGIFTLNVAGISGSMLQQLNHGISTSMLFLLVGFMYERRHTREIQQYGGLYKPMPRFAIIFLITIFASMGLPPLNGFIGEIRILAGAYQMSPWWTGWAALGILLGAAYLIWLYQRTTLGQPSEANRNLPDLSLREIAIAAPLVALMFWIGIYPRPFFEFLQPAANSIVKQVRNPH